MSKANEIKQLLKDKFSEIYDPLMGESKFIRRKNSTVYQKKNEVLSHKIYFYMELSPSFIPTADAYLKPTYYLQIPEVSQKALELMENNIYFQDNHEIIIGQPLYIFDINNDIEHYLSLSLNKDNSNDLEQLKKLLLNYTLPEINMVNTIQDFINIYEEDSPFLIAKNTIVYFIAAYLLTFQEDKAAKLLEKEFSSKGSKSMYKPLHKNFFKIIS